MLYGMAPGDLSRNPSFKGFLKEEDISQVVWNDKVYDARKLQPTQNIKSYKGVWWQGAWQQQTWVHMMCVVTKSLSGCINYSEREKFVYGPYAFYREREFM